MTVTEEQVREQLMKVIDPELFVNIVDLGLIYLVELEEAGAEAQPVDEGGGSDESPPEAASDNDAPSTEVAASSEGAEQSASASEAESEAIPSGPRTNVKIEMTMTSPMCPAGPQLVANSKQVVGQIEGVGDVEVKVVMDPPWTPDRMTDEAKDKLGIF